MELFKLFGSIAVNNADANDAIDVTSEKAESFGGKLKSGIGTAAKWGTAIVGGASAAAGAMVKFAESSASTADNVDKMSQKIGISREAYQELDFICSQSGTSVDSLQMGMKSLVSAMDGASAGIKKGTVDTEKLEKAQLKAKNAGIEVQKAQLAYNDAVEKYGASSSQATKASLNLEKCQNYLASANQDVENASVKSADEANKQAQIFQKLGISVTDANGKLRNQEDVMWETLSALQGMENQTEKARLATELFGRSGTELMPLLNGASGSIEEMKQQAHDLGLVLDDEIIDNGVNLTDSLDQTKRAFQSIITKLGAALMPVLEKVSDYIQKGMPMIQGLIERITPIITTLFESLLPPLMDLAESLFPVVIDLIETLIPPLTDIITAILPVITDLLTMLLPPIVEIVQMILPLLISLLEPLLPLLEPIFQLLQPLIDLLMMIIEPLVQLLNMILPPLIEVTSFLSQGLLSALQPILEWLADFLGNTLGVAITAITDLIGWCADGFKSAWEGIQAAWSVVADFFSNIWNGIKKIFEPVVNWFKNTFSKAWEGIKSIWNAVSGFFSGIWSGIKNTFSSVGNWFKNIFSGAWNGIKSAWGGVSGFFSGIWSGIQGAFSHVTDWFKNVFTNAWQGIKNVFSVGGQIFDGIKDGILNAFKFVVNGIISGLNWVIAQPFNGINGALRTIKGLDFWGWKPFDWINEIPVPQIPTLAKGGVLPKGQTGYLEGDGAEAVVPLEQNTEWTQQVAKQIHAFTVETKDKSKDITPQISDYRQNQQISLIQMIDDKFDRLISIIGQYFPEFAKNMQHNIVLDDGTMVAKLTPKIDKQLGVIYKRKERG